MIVWLTVWALAFSGVSAAAQQSGGADVAAARSRIEARYEVVPLRDAIGLRPKDRASRVRMIEVSDEGIAIDGNPVSGRELRDRVGADAEAILPLSYFTAAERREFLRQNEPPPPPPRARPAPEPQPEPPSSPGRAAGERRRVGERVHVLSSVTVRRDEEVRGQAIAVIGSVRVDGKVSDQVVAVLGSVTLGPDAEVDGDVIAIGGRINMADGARVKGDMREISLRSPDRRWDGAPVWAVPFMVYPFTGAARMLGTLFRLFILGLFASVVVLLARQPVERIGQRAQAEPVKMAFVGILAQLLFLPALILAAVVLAISIIGIPLLLLIPFAVLTMLLVFLGGFTGVAYTLGGWGAGRAGLQHDQPFMRVWIGAFIILMPMLIARLIGIVGGPFQLGALLVATVAFFVEYLVWTTGFGAALTTAFEQWRNRRGPAANGIMTGQP